MKYTTSWLSMFLLVLGLTKPWAVLGGHQVTFTNNCPFAITPMWKNNAMGASHDSGPQLAIGNKFSMSVPEIYDAARFFAQDPKNSCSLPDGGDCSLAECDFGQEEPRFWQCNLSRVSGYNLPVQFSWVGGGTTQTCGLTRACLTSNCPPTQAYIPGPDAQACDVCILQCDTTDVGIHLEYCPQGSTIPDMGQHAAPPAHPSTTSHHTTSSSSHRASPAPSTTHAAPVEIVQTSKPAPTSSSTSSAKGGSGPAKCGRRRKRSASLGSSMTDHAKRALSRLNRAHAL